VVGVIFGDDDPDGLGDGVRIDAVELDRPRGLGLVMADQPHRRLVALDQRPRRDHLAHIEPRTVLAAEATERGVGDARHGCEHDRHVESDRADVEGASGCGGDSHIPSILPDPEPVSAHRSKL